MIIFYLFSSFFLSAFTYKEDYIKNDYEGYESFGLKLFDYFERVTLNATLLLYLIKITVIITSISAYLERYKNNKSDNFKEKEETKKDIINYYTNRPHFYFIIVNILNLLYWYFLIIFGNVFVHSQKKVIITFIVTLVINLLIEVVISSIYAATRRISLIFDLM